MGGSRHSKNAGTMGSEAQTYHERKALGYGTVRERLGKACCSTPAPPSPYHVCHPCWCSGVAHSPLLTRRFSNRRCCLQDSAGNFDDCRLTLQPAVVRIAVNPHHRMPGHGRKRSSP